MEEGARLLFRLNRFSCAGVSPSDNYLNTIQLVMSNFILLVISRFV